jgi:hypothetical protein
MLAAENTYLCISECMFIHFQETALVQAVQVVQHKKLLLKQAFPPSSGASSASSAT